MDVNSVSSSVSAAAVSQLQTRRTEQDQQGLQALLQAQAAKRAQESSATGEKESATQVQAAAQANRPSVNTSGQTVGTTINVTA